MHSINPLPYDFNALEPFIDAQTMSIHHDKHHQAYCDNLNKALSGSGLENENLVDLLADLEALPAAIQTAVRNNGGGVYNHNLFWEIMSPGGGGAPQGELAAKIDTEFGGFTQFKSAFAAAALSRFGSGWAWLTVDENSRLAISSTPNQDTPLSEGKIPILGLDVWEHAYYLRYQNRRAEYIEQWWQVVDWEKVGANHAAAIE